MVEAIINCPVHCENLYVWYEHYWYYLLCPRWMERNFYVWFLIWPWNIFLTTWNFCFILRQVVVPMNRILSYSGHYGTLKIRLQETFNQHRYTISWTSCNKLENCIKHCGNTVDNNFHIDRLGCCSNVHATLNSCAQVTFREDKEQYLLYKLYTSLK